MTENIIDDTHRKSQLIQLRLLLELKKICDENEIPFLIIGGTALGARRHQGFIPWDDDVDVGILGTEYPRFLKVMEILDSPRYLSKIDVESNHYLPFSKFRLRNTVRIEEGHWIPESESGIDIDVFPYNNIPNNKILQKLYFNIFSLLRHLYWYCCLPKDTRPKFLFEDCTLLRKIIRETVWNITQHKLTHKFVKRIIGISLQKFSTIFNIFNTKLVLTVSAMDLNHFRVPREDFLNPTPVVFEKHKFYAPGHLDNYLTTMYGDYMTIPPEEEQIVHSVTRLEFGEYDDIDSYPLSKLENYKL